MLSEIIILVLNVIVLVIASVSLGYVSKCGNHGNLTIIKNTNYCMLLLSILLIFGCGYSLYHGKEIISEEKFSTMTLIAGILLFQFGLVQYASMSNIMCGDATTQENIQNCYKAYMIIGGFLIGFGGFSVYNK